jgi:phage-related protein
MRFDDKAIVWIGSSLDDLKDFPESACRSAGHQLGRVQRGRLPDDWKPMSAIGVGVCELRIFDLAGAFRVV